MTPKIQTTRPISQIICLHSANYAKIARKTCLPLKACVTTITFLLLTVFALPVFAADIYVATNGNDATGNGTSGNPYKTIGKAASVVKAGDIVLVKAGTYVEDAITPAANGTAPGSTTAPNYIVFKPAPGDEGKVIIKYNDGKYANDAAYSAANKGANNGTDVFNLWQRNYIWIEGFRFEDYKYARTTININGDGNVVMNCTFKNLGCKPAADWHWIGGGCVCGGVTVPISGGKLNVIRNNYFQSIYGEVTTFLSSNSNIILENTFVGTKAKDDDANSTNGVRFSGNLNNVFAYNYEGGSESGYTVWLDVDVKDFLLLRNVAHNSAGLMFNESGCTRNWAYENIVYNVPRGANNRMDATKLPSGQFSDFPAQYINSGLFTAFWDTGSTWDARWVNNVTYNLKEGINIERSWRDEVRNNIGFEDGNTQHSGETLGLRIFETAVLGFHSWHGLDLKGGGPQIIKNNLWYSTKKGTNGNFVRYMYPTQQATTVANFAAQIGSTTELSADPQFENAAAFDFRLKATSPAKGSGYNGVDRGAYAVYPKTDVGYDKNLAPLADVNASFSQLYSSAKPGNTINIEIKLSKNATKTMNFTIEPVAGDARLNTDFEFVGGNQVSFTSGQNTKTVSIKILNPNPADKIDQLLALRITPVGGSTVTTEIGPRNLHLIRIIRVTEYAVTLSDVGDSMGKSIVTYYTPGTVVTIDAKSRPNYTFKTWSDYHDYKAPLANRNSAITTFTMPEQNVSLRADWNLSTTQVAVTGISVSPTTLSLAAGATSTLRATVNPTNATDKAVLWTSTNPLVATVSPTGVVTAVSAGTATITVTALDSKYGNNQYRTATCVVTVTGTAPGTATISLSPTTNTFPAATAGYTTRPAAQTFTVTNTSTVATGAMTVALSGANASSFTLSTTTLASITAQNGTGTFTIQPNAGLSAGTYTATVTVSGTGLVSKTATVTFTVNPAALTPAVMRTDGFYTIKNVNSNRYLDVEGNTVASGSNVVQGGTAHNFAAKTMWKLKAESTGYYSLHSVANDNLVIDIAAESTENGANIGLWTYGGGNHQQFKFVQVTGETYTIRSKNTNDASGLDVENASTAANGNVHLWTIGTAGTGTNQHWIMEWHDNTPTISLSPATATFPAANAGYATRPAAQTFTVTNTSVVPTVATGAMTLALSGANAGSFTLSATSLASIAAQNGTATFTVQPNLGLAAGTYTATVTVGGSGLVSKTATVTFVVNVPPLIPATLRTDGFYTIKNVNSNRYLEIEGCVMGSGTNVIQGVNAHNFLPSTMWQLKDAGNGYYTMHSVTSGNFALDVFGAVADNGANINMWTFNSGNNQQFKFIQVSEGVYTIRTRISNDASCVEVESASMAAGGNVIQWAINGGANQNWILEFHDYTPTATQLHNFVNYTSNNNATCTADGTETGTCSRCGVKDTRTKVGSQLGHNFVWTVTTAPTCDAAGEETEMCSRCPVKGATRSIAKLTEGCECKHNYQAVITAPTCTAEGFTTHTCSICKGSYTDSKIPALGHNYQAVITAPTCTAEGFTTHTCSICQNSYTDSKIPALGHNYQAVVTAPTCTAEGFTTHTCSICKDSYTDSKIPAAHTWGEQKVIEEASCTAAGYSAIVCSVCNAEKDKVTIPQLAHTFGAWTEKTAATCNAAGEETRSCALCGKIENQPIAKLTHDFSEWTEKTAATCNAAGEETRTCALCGKTENQPIAKLTHDFSEWKTTKAATCGEAGEQTEQCALCDELGTKTKVIPATGKHTFVWIVNPENDKEMIEVCAVCGEPSGAKPKLIECTHVFDLWKETTKATCSTVGIETEQCSLCEILGTKTRDIPMLEHNYQAIVTAPTCTADGFTTHTCSVCKNSYTDSKIPAAHIFGEQKVIEEATCTAAGYSAIVCSVCNAEKDKVTIPQLAHTFGTWTEKTAATCNAAGEETRTCALCGKIENQPIAKLTHDFSNWTEKTAATCNTAGEETRTCALCGKIENQPIAKLTHVFSNWKTTKAATCGEAGEQTEQCALCDELGTKTKVIPATGKHTFVWIINPANDKEMIEVCADCGTLSGATKPVDCIHDFEWKITIKASCEKAGVESEVCKLCSAVNSTKPIPQLEHIFGNWTEKTAATCNAAGEETRTCSLCGKIETQPIAKLEHVFSNWKTTKEPTCGEAGEQTEQCALCDELGTKTKVIPATGKHTFVWIINPANDKEMIEVCADCGTLSGETKPVDCIHDFEWKITIKASCEKAGVESEVCKLCGAVNSTKPIPQLEHIFGNWAGKTAATCNAAGEETRSCTLCGKTETQPIAKLEHVFSNWKTTKEPTCGEAGEQTEQCALCAALGTKTKVIPATGEHTFIWIINPANKNEEIEVCSVCNEPSGAPARPIVCTHIFEWKVTTAATCENAGTETEICSKCEAHGTTQPVAQLEHNFIYASNNNATCSEDGTESGSCTICGRKNTRIEVGSKLEHNFVWQTTIEPTCRTAGKQVEACSLCGKISETMVLPIINCIAYKLTVENGFSGKYSYFEGEEVAITANTEAGGNVFKQWSSAHVTFANPLNTSTTFTMPAKNVTVTAEFETVGIETIAEKAVKIYPNPAQNELKIDNGKLTINKIEIVDFAGRTVETWRAASLLNDHTASLQQIDVSNLPQGIYIIKIYTGDSVIVRRFVKE